MVPAAEPRGPFPADLRQSVGITRSATTSRLLLLSFWMQAACAFFVCFRQLTPRSMSLSIWAAGHRGGVCVSLLSAVSSHASGREAFPSTSPKASRNCCGVVSFMLVSHSGYMSLWSTLQPRRLSSSFLSVLVCSHNGVDTEGLGVPALRSFSYMAICFWPARILFAEGHGLVACCLRLVHLCFDRSDCRVLVWEVSSSL